MIARYATSGATIDRPTLRERAYAGIRQVPNILVFVAIAIGGGLGTSWLMIERGTPLTTKRYGPWSIWIAAGKPDTDPYTRAHHLRRGMLVAPGGLVETYFASTDNAGQGLRAYCDYRISGIDPAALSWSIAAFTRSGGLIQNRAERYAYTSATVMRSNGGSFQITLSRDAQPGNWLPVGGAGSFALVFTLYEPTQRVSEDGGATSNLPLIEQVQCR